MTEEQQKNIENDDLSMAELANKELNAKDEEIAKLKKQLAKSKLYSTATEEEDEPMSKEEAIKVITSGKASNYDFAEATCAIVDRELEEGNPNPLGENGDEIRDFLGKCIEECDGNKSRFTAIYQARIGKDDNKSAMAYNKIVKGD